MTATAAHLLNSSRARAERPSTAFRSDRTANQGDSYPIATFVTVRGSLSQKTTSPCGGPHMSLTGRRY